MKTKMTATVLIYCLIFQIPFMNTGCTSFYTVSSESELAHYHNYDGNVLIKFNNGTEIEVPGHGFYYLEKDKIDSVKIVKYNSGSYQRFWLKEKKSIIVNSDNSPIINSDTISHFYFVIGESGVYRLIDKEDIGEIQIQKPDGLKTDLLIAGAILLLGVGILIMIGSSMKDML